MYCNSKEQCSHLDIQKDKSGYCILLHVGLQVSENKPKLLFIQDNDCMLSSVALPESDDTKYCVDNLGRKCFYLNIEYPPKDSNDVCSGYCNLHKVNLATIEGEAFDLILRLNNCKGIYKGSGEYVETIHPVKPSELLNKAIDNLADDLSIDRNELIKPPVQPLNSASSFLIKADDTMKERGKTYDKQGESDSERSMGKTVRAFNEITGRDLKESEGWLLMLILKQTRQYSTDEYHEDSALDSVAYSALLAEALSNE